MATCFEGLSSLLTHGTSWRQAVVLFGYGRNASVACISSGSLRFVALEIAQPTRGLCESPARGRD